jgi:hypothetical protein
MARVQDLDWPRGPQEDIPEYFWRSGTVAECTDGDYTVSAPEEKGNCSEGTVARKKKRRARRITGRSWEAPSFPGTSGPSSNTSREPKGLVSSPIQLRGMSSVQLRRQLRPLIEFRQRIGADTLPSLRYGRAPPTQQNGKRPTALSKPSN